jgi:hypothetical protein
MRRSIILTLLVGVSLTAGAAAQRDDDHGRIKHVLLISIDGFHAVDFANCSHGIAGVNGGVPYCPNLATLGATGINYNAVSTSKPSDSFPGLMTLFTGATPRTMGVYYDVSYDRTLDGPTIQTGNGNGPGTCTPGAAATGYSTEFDEGIDLDKTKLNGGAPNAGLTDGGIASIDPKKLDRNPANGCAPVYPWQFVRTNTIIGVIHAAGGYTAWSDKHPAYSSVAGPGGVLDDYYAPEINSNVIPLPGVSTPAGMSCATVPDPNSDLTAWTNSFQNIQCYDTLKVNAVLNEIAGKNHDGAPAQTPTIFGMNYQAVSVGQKLIEKSNGMTGGYLDAAGTPTAGLLSEIQYVDATIGEMVQGLKSRGIYDSTLFIITAKHGQSPIDPNLYRAVPGATGNGMSPATIIATDLPAAMPFSESPLNPTGLGSTEDDVSLIWLTNSSYTDQAVTLLEDNRSTWGAGMLFYGPSLAINYNTPGLPPNDPRTPDIIITPNIGVTYTGSTTKLAEHGGFAHDDTNVIMLLSNPRFHSRTVYTAVTTSQVAPTVLSALGLDPSLLDAVRLEGTTVLPDVQFPK